MIIQKIRQIFGAYSASKIPAAPWPVPMHMVTMPYLRLWRRRAWTGGGRADGPGRAQRVAQGNRRRPWG